MNPLAKLELYAVVLVVLALGATGAYFYAKHQGVMEERERWEAKAAAATKADLESLQGAVATANQIAMGTQQLLNQGRAQRVIDRGVIQREVKTNTVYLNDCLAPAGLGMWNSLSAGRPILPSGSAGSEPDKAMPDGNGPAGGGLKGGDIAPRVSGGTINLRRVPDQPRRPGEVGG